MCACVFLKTRPRIGTPWKQRVESSDTSVQRSKAVILLHRVMQVYQLRIIPDTPWDCNICRSIDPWHHPWPFLGSPDWQSHGSRLGFSVLTEVLYNGRVQEVGASLGC